MDNRQFDAFVRSLASGTNRREMLKGLLGFGIGSMALATLDTDTDAARRGYAGPPIQPLPSAPCLPVCNAGFCGNDGCGGTCACAAGWICGGNGTCVRQCADDPVPCIGGAGHESCYCRGGLCFNGADMLNECDGDAQCPYGYICAGGVGYCTHVC